MQLRTLCFAVLIFTGYCFSAQAASPAAVTNKRISRPAASADFINRYRYKYRNPFLAGFLSGMMWGTGQIYCGEYTKGSLFVFGDLIYKGLLVGLILKLNNRYSTGGTDPVRWSEFSATDRGLVIGYIVTYIGLTVLSTADAVQSAVLYNKKHSPGSGLHFSLVEDRGRGSLRFSWGLPF